MGSNAHPDLSAAARERLMKALAATFRTVPPNLSPNLRLGDIDGWDSFNAVTFSFELETAFGVTVGDYTFTDNETIGDVVAFLRECGAAPA
jgi:acyl carrier protein